MPKSVKTKIKAAVTVGALCAVCMSGTMFAYLTDTDTETTETFTAGTVEGTLTCDIPTDEKIVPLDEITLTTNPTISLSSGSEDAVAFISVTQPYIDMKIADDDTGVLGTEEAHEVFDLTGIDDTNWIEIDSSSSDTDNTITTIYGYKKVLTDDGDDANTSELFTGLKVVNTTEEYLKDTVEMELKPYLIQADNIGLTIESGVITDATLEDAYTKFSGQNP